MLPATRRLERMVMNFRMVKTGLSHFVRDFACDL